MSVQNINHDIHDLLFRLLENDLTDSQRDRLIEWSKSDPNAVAIYHDFLQSYSAISYEVSSSVRPDYGTSADTQFDQALWESLLNDAETAPEVEVAPAEPHNELIQKVVYPPREKRRISKIGMVFVAMNAAAILCILLFVKFAPPAGGHPVATLTDSLHAKWADAEGKMDKGMSFAGGGQSLLLREGCAEFKFNNHARITIEGPSEFQFLAEDQIKLIYGRLYAVVPREAIGFTVKTPSAQIVDLGTEFGVQTDFRGDTSLHVLKGKTVLIAGDRSNKVSVEVGEGAAKRVLSTTQTVSDIACNADLFVRQIDSDTRFMWRGEAHLCVADIIAGGSGFGRVRPLTGLCAATGRYTSSIDRGVRRSADVYNLVPGSTFIDGVFVPDGNQDGTIVVTSAGDTFRCPDTQGMISHEITVYTGDIQERQPTISPAVFDGHTYRNNAVVMLHSNAGITFDLQAIRQSLPGLEVTSFQAFGGLSEALSAVKTQLPDVDFWIVVDGEVRYEKTGLMLEDHKVSFDIELGPEDRFLTLIVTDGFRPGEASRDYAAWNNDFFYLVEPKLQITQRFN
jgi:hypothetical protein